MRCTCVVDDGEERRTMQWFWDAYLPNAETRTTITASPLNASLAQLAGLPAALIIVDENDVLRDEGEAYARKLSQAGVCVTSVCYNGTVLDFLLLDSLSHTVPARSAMRQVTDALAAALHA